MVLKCLCSRIKNDSDLLNQILDDNYINKYPFFMIKLNT